MPWNNELTRGPVLKSLLWFAIPMILGDLLQQCYNVADTLIVGRFLGADRPGRRRLRLLPDDIFNVDPPWPFPWGSGVVFSIRYGQGDIQGLKERIYASFLLLAGVTVVLNILVFAGTDWIIWFMKVA